MFAISSCKGDGGLESQRFINHNITYNNYSLDNFLMSKNSLRGFWNNKNTILVGKCLTLKASTNFVVSRLN